MRAAGGRHDWLLPPVVAGWPGTVVRGDRPGAADGDLLDRLRRDQLYWPAPRSGAPAPRAIATDAAGLARARHGYAAAEVLLTRDAAAVDPSRLEAVFGPPGPVATWAVLGGAAAEGTPTAEELLAFGTGRCPWTGGPLSLADALDAQALLRAAALRARGPRTLLGMSRWKRRCLRPFLSGPDGPPRAAAAGHAVASPVVWGAAAGAPGALRVEDGFLRSVGLGLRHVPPVSLVIAAGAPYFDATRPNSFEAAVEGALAAGPLSPALTARAARLRARIVALGITKYSLPGHTPLPDPGGRLAVLVPGQVATDASIRLGGRAVRTDADLLAAVRARFPEAFVLYKPHPDVLTGLRAGAAGAQAVARHADATVGAASADACLAWADRVATITSLMGFEALLRGKAVTTFGRPFYAGWGLTDDVDGPPRDRRLDLDTLTAIALILYPSYIDPATGLPAPAERALDALAAARDGAGRPRARLLRAWRDLASALLNRLPG